MPDTLTNPEAEAWQRVLATVGAPLEGDAAVYGPGAERVALAVRTAGPRPTHVVEAMPSPGANGGEAPSRRLQLVVALHAWGGLRHLDWAVRTATGWLDEGGVLIIGDLHAERLVRASPSMYPSAVLYRRHPETAQWLIGRSAPPAAMEMAIIRSGLGRKLATAFDLPVRLFADGDELRGADPAAGWRGLDRLPAQQRAALVDMVAASRRPSSPVEHEPWHLVAGRRQTAAR